LACLNYESAHREFPAGRSGLGQASDHRFAPRLDVSETGGWSFLVAILPFIDQATAFDQLHVEELNLLSYSGGPSGGVSGQDWDYESTSGNNLEAISVIGEQMPGYVCPSTSLSPARPLTFGDVKLGTGSYAGSMGVVRSGMRSITDGASNTLCVGETLDANAGSFPRRNYWAWGIAFRNSLRDTIRPLNSPEGALGTRSAFASNHPGGANFAFSDGHTSFMSDNIDQDLYEALSSRAGGEIVDPTAL